MVLHRIILSVSHALVWSAAGGTIFFTGFVFVHCNKVVLNADIRGMPRGIRYAQAVQYVIAIAALLNELSDVLNVLFAFTLHLDLWNGTFLHLELEAKPMHSWTVLLFRWKLAYCDFRPVIARSRWVQATQHSKKLTLSESGRSFSLWHGENMH